MVYDRDLPERTHLAVLADGRPPRYPGDLDGRIPGIPARAGKVGSRSVTYRSAWKASARVSATRSPPPIVWR